jgi:hypothetical protein
MVNSASAPKISKKLIKIREKIKSSIIQKSKVKSSTQKLKVAFRVTFDNWHGSFASAMMKLMPMFQK